MAGRDRPNVALSSKQRNHRRLPHKDGSLTASGLRFSKLQKLPIEGCCNVFLRKLGSGSAPIFGVEPRLDPDAWLFATEKGTKALNRDFIWTGRIQPAIEPLGLEWATF